MSDAALVASDPLNSAWVNANAGSGKTYVLTARVIRLLLDDTPPANLLCLTYTRAAAAEMRARVFQILGAWALADDATLAAGIARIDGAPPDAERTARARRLFATALETPGGLKIQTIHAFCERLVARFPIEADAPVPFTVLTETDAATMKAEARRAALNAMGEDTSDALMAVLAPVLSADGFADLFDGRSAQFIAEYGDADPWAAAGLPTGTTPGMIEDEAGFDAPDRVALYRRAAALLAEGKKSDTDIAATILSALAAHEDDRFDAMSGCLLTKGGELRAKGVGTKDVRAQNPALFGAIDEEAIRSTELIARRASAGSAAMAHMIARLGRDIAARYAVAKRRRGMMDFDDLIRAAVALLADGAGDWVRFKLDGGLDHILIDEAQDTSPAQWELVRRLSEDFFAGASARGDAVVRTLFVVGDKKQSIYSFQGADLQTFSAMREEFAGRARGAGAAFQTPVLNTSRRSTRAVLTLVDAVFRADPRLAAAVAEAEWNDHVAHRADAEGAVDIWPLAEADEIEDGDAWWKPVDAPTADDPVSRLAGELAKTIKGWIGRESVFDKDTGALRPMSAGDVLILVRTRARLARTLIRKLKQEGVPVAGADRLALLEHIAVKDLIAFGRAALLPQDDLNLAALLRSPFFDLDETTLFHLAHGRGGVSLWGRLTQAAHDGVDGVPKAAAMAAHETLSRAVNRLGRDAPFDFYARLLSEGGRRAMLARFGEEAEDVIDAFLAEAASFEETHAPSLEAFLHVLESAGGEVKRDPDAAGGAVRVLTAHGAKGLEAPVVILPDTMSLPSATYTPNLLAHNGALVWRPSGAPEAQEAADAYRAREHEEHKRLLYVALTRPRDRLVVCGVKPGRATPKDAITWYDAVSAGFDALGGAPIDTPFGQGRRYGAPPPPASGAVAANTPVALPDWTRETAPEEELIGTVRPSRLSHELAFDDAATGFGVARGRILHRLLQSLPDLPAETRAAAAARYLNARATDWPEAARAEAAARILAILDDPRFAEAFAPGSRAEVAIAGKVAALGPGGFISGQIDRMAVTAERVLIIDYKTNRDPPRTAEATPKAYLKQLALYREAMRAAFPGRIVTTALLWTETPDLIALPDSLLDAALAALSSA